MTAAAITAMNVGLCREPFIGRNRPGASVVSVTEGRTEVRREKTCRKRRGPDAARRFSPVFDEREAMTLLTL